MVAIRVLKSLTAGAWQALARLVYARCDIAILDDSFSALDSKTGDQVISNLLGPKGWFRQKDTTVIWVTNEGKQESAWSLRDLS